MDQHFRQMLPKFVTPILKIYKKLNLTPNHVTILGLGTALVASAAIASKLFIIGITLWWISRLFDGTDGIYARQEKMTSHFGAYLDFVTDMAAYGAMVIGFKIAMPEFDFLWTLILFLYILCSVSALVFGNMEASLGIDQKDNRGLRLGAGLAEAGETGIAYTVFAIFNQAMLPWICLWVFILSFTVASRTFLAYKLQMKHQATES